MSVIADLRQRMGEYLGRPVPSHEDPEVTVTAILDKAKRTRTETLDEIGQVLEDHWLVCEQMSLGCFESIVSDLKAGRPHIPRGVTRG